ncbi:Uncharacterized protein Rs2_34847 [Raphanus sativus]|nr:Uncharacterized protein Rs2_34847 [Raphanus sativus]
MGAFYAMCRNHVGWCVSHVFFTLCACVLYIEYTRFETKEQSNIRDLRSFDPDQTRHKARRRAERDNLLEGNFANFLINISVTFEIFVLRRVAPLSENNDRLTIVVGCVSKEFDQKKEREEKKGTKGTNFPSPMKQWRSEKIIILHDY